MAPKSHPTRARAARIAAAGAWLPARALSLAIDAVAIAGSLLRTIGEREALSLRARSVPPREPRGRERLGEHHPTGGTQ